MGVNLYNLNLGNFYPLEVVCDSSETQLQVGAGWRDLYNITWEKWEMVDHF